MSRIAVGATATAVANHVIPTSARHSRTCARRRSNEPPQHSTAHECLSYHRLILHHQSIYSPLQLYYIHFLHGCFIQDATTQAHAAPKQHERNVRIIHPPKQVWPFCAITTPQKNVVVQRQSDIYLHSIVRCCLLKNKKMNREQKKKTPWPACLFYSSWMDGWMDEGIRSDRCSFWRLLMFINPTYVVVAVVVLPMTSGSSSFHFELNIKI